MLAKDQMNVIRRRQEDAPVLVVPIAQELGVNVYNAPDWPNGISGMIVRDEQNGGASGYAIYVNGKDHTVRRRFTIAHEIGHFILHQHLIGDGLVEDALLRAEGLSNRVEAEANRMAADILMPWNIIGECQDQGDNTIEELAKILNVSRDAMSIRLLGISYQRAVEAGHA